MNAKARTSAGRPQQPKCSCGKALYKRMDAGAVKTSDPYAYCRNAACEHYNKDQSGASRFEPLAKKSGAPKAKTTPPPAEAKPAKKPKSTPPPATSKAVEPRPIPKTKTMPPPAKSKAVTVLPPPPVKTPKERTKSQILKLIKEDAPHAKAAIGLALALLSKETESKADSNDLVVELGLTDKFGIEPVALAKRNRKNKGDSVSA